MGLDIARVLHSIAFVPAQKLNEQSGEVFAARTHNYLFRVHSQSPKGMQIVGYSLPEAIGSLSAAGVQQFFPAGAEYFPGQLGPDGEGKKRGVRPVGAEIYGISLNRRRRL